MAFILIILFFLSVTQGSLINESNSYNITLNSSLTTNINSSWFSPSGLFAFGFYPQDDGFAVGIWLTTKPEITVVWTAYLYDSPFSPNTTIVLTSHGLLLLITTYGDYFLITESDSATSASMFDSGNFVLYKHSEIIWQSFDYPSDTILGGQKLVEGDSLWSSDISVSQRSIGGFALRMQHDGNLVAYPRNSSMSGDDSYWSTATYSTYYESLNLDSSGSLYMVGFDEPRKVLNPHTGSPMKNNETKVYRATLNPQGNFVLYSHIFTTPPSNLTRMNTEWAALQNPCKAKGSCGVNSYCSPTPANETECLCFPGFLYYNNTKNGKILGCYRGFTDEEACIQRGLEFSFNITALENIELQALEPYSMMNLSKNACSKSCLDDCRCWASMYADGGCKKLKDPIIDALFDKSISATVFIKVKVPPTASMNLIKQHVVVERKKLVTVLALAFGFLALVCTLMAFSSFLFYRVQAHRYQSLPQNVDLGFIGDHLILRSFSFDELQKATDDFKEVIGRNSSGEVYKGFISEGKKAVAVKRLERMFEGGEFRAEITAIAQTHHRNLVRLLGFCMHGAIKLLVYEFMSNGSLVNLLLAQPGWKERVRVALDVARGILYLHQECETRIIHCNIKPHNILFDESWTAKISDFGLSKPLSPNQSGTLTSVRGTRGYLAPEWFRNTLISTKVDIYSFGVVLLEILCCTSDQMEIDIYSEDKTHFITWVYNCFDANELSRLIGNEETVDIYMFGKMVKVGLLCIQDDPEARPTIKEVILMLEGTSDIPIPPPPIPLLIV